MIISTEIITAVSAVFKTILRMSVSSVWIILAVIVLRLALRRIPKQARVLMWLLAAVRLTVPFSFESRFSVTPDPARLIPPTAAVVPVAADSYIFSALWLAVTAGMLIYMLVSFLRLNLRVRESLVLRENIYICDKISSPFVLGVFRPKIYVPSAIGGRPFGYILLHEQAHIRRLDTVWKPLAFLILCLHWFNPLVWAAYILFTHDIELACDERVIKKLPLGERKEYSTALIDCCTRNRFSAACPFAFGENPVKRRIKSILGYKKPKAVYKVAAVILCAAATVLFLTNPVTAKITRDSGAVIATPLENLWHEPPATEPFTEASAEKAAEAITQAVTEPPAEDTETEESYYEAENEAGETAYGEPEESNYYEPENHSSAENESAGGSDGENGYVEIEPFQNDYEEFLHGYDYASGLRNNSSSGGATLNSWDPFTDANANNVMQWEH